MCAKEQYTQGQSCSVGVFFFHSYSKEGLFNQVTNRVFEMSKGGVNWGENFPAFRSSVELRTPSLPSVQTGNDGAGRT